MAYHNTDRTKYYSSPRDFSRRNQLKSPTLRCREWHLIAVIRHSRPARQIGGHV
jgi:hypothetical protein